MLPEVAEVADRVTMLRRGAVVHETTVAALTEVARERIELHLGVDPPAGLLAGVPGVASWSVDGRTLVVDVDGSVAEAVKAVAPYDVQRIVTHQRDLEDVFFAYYRQDGGRL